MAIITDNIVDNNSNNRNASGSVAILPNFTFIPMNDDIIVGIDKTIVAPAKNFMTLFRLFDTTVAYVSVIEDKISL